jgi:peptide deformylase
MKLPIIAYGDPVLRQRTKEIDENYPELDVLIKNMFDTMYAAYGVGIAAPQIGLPIRLFVIDGEPYAEDEPMMKSFKKVFINPRIIDETGDLWSYSEGCLSIPDIREDISRKEEIKIVYFDENWVEHEETYTGLAARVIQHEYDHIEGILFTDKLSPLKKALIKGKLNDISKGKIDVDYKMKFPRLKKGHRF